MVLPELPSELEELVMAVWFRDLHWRMHRRKYFNSLRFFDSGAVQRFVRYWEDCN